MCKTISCITEMVFNPSTPRTPQNLHKSRKIFWTSAKTHHHHLWHSLLNPSHLKLIPRSRRRTKTQRTYFRHLAQETAQIQRCNTCIVQFHLIVRRDSSWLRSRVWLYWYSAELSTRYQTFQIDYIFPPFFRIKMAYKRLSPIHARDCHNARFWI